MLFAIARFLEHFQGVRPSDAQVLLLEPFCDEHKSVDRSGTAN
jgi:hypothetical protein